MQKKSKMKVLVIDGQGGGIGKQVISATKKLMPQIQITAVGTNSIATTSMKKAGADQVATGENAVVVNCRKTDVIIGPIGIVIADALLGEITPAMARSIGQSNAKRILIPINHCDNIVVGVGDLNTTTLVNAVVQELRKEAIAFDNP